MAAMENVKEETMMGNQSFQEEGMKQGTVLVMMNGMI